MGAVSNWWAILAAFAVCVAGAVQVGRIAPVATAIQVDAQFDLVTIGWLVSLITLASAAFGLIAGYWVVRIGLRTALVAGACVMGLCATVAALVPVAPVLLGARVLEGLGYLAVVVAAPTLIAREASGRDTPFALALFGTFFTLGLSLAAFGGGAMSEGVGWRGWFIASAALVVAVGLAAARVIPKDPPANMDQPKAWDMIAQMRAAPWLLGAAFLGLTLLSLSILSLLPIFLVQNRDLAPSVAGGVTGSVAFASILGSLCYGAFAARLSEKIILAVAGAALIIAVFLAFAETAEVSRIVTFSAVAVFMSGALVAQTFAAVPRVAGTAHLIGPTNGLVAQLGSVGALTGPPGIGVLIAYAGWGAVPFAVAGFTLSYAALLILALRSEADAPRHEP